MPVRNFQYFVIVDTIKHGKYYSEYYMTCTRLGFHLSKYQLGHNNFTKKENMLNTYILGKILSSYITIKKKEAVI